MKSAKIGELRDGLSRFLAYVRRGGRVRVFDRGTPVAEIVPYEPLPSSGNPRLDAHLEALERRGGLIRGTGLLPKDCLTWKLVKAKRSVVEALLEERREGR